MAKSNSLLDIKGEWQVENGKVENGTYVTQDKKWYVWNEYKVLLGPLWPNSGNQEYRDASFIEVWKQNVKIRDFVIRQYMPQYIPKDASDFPFVLFDAEPENAGLFHVEHYKGFPDTEILSIHCIRHVLNYEKKVLDGMNWKEFYTVRKSVLKKIKSLFPSLSYSAFLEGKNNSYFILNTVPLPNRYNYSVGIFYDTKKGKIVLLNNPENTSLILGMLGIPFKKEMLNRIIDIIKIASFSKDNLILNSFDEINKSPFVEDANIDKIKQAIKKYKIALPQFQKDKIVFYTAGYGFPANLIKWEITKKGKYAIKQTILVQDLYAPSFVTENVWKAPKRSKKVYPH